MFANTTGGNNTAIGYAALSSNTTNSHNTAVGYNALLNNDAQYNTAVGKDAVQANTSGSRLVGVGNRALYSNTTGNHNHAFGDHALFACTTASANTAVGYESATALTTGHSSVAIGYQSLHDATTAIRNIAIGYQAGANITDGGDNICIGYQSGVYDTALTTGDDNVFLGDYVESGANNVVKSIAIGYNAIGKGSNTGMMRASSGMYQSNNSSSWSTTSDIRIKKNVVNNNTGLDKINQIQVRNFEYRTEEEITDFDNPRSAMVDKQGLQVGVIAQEIKTILPDVVEELSTGVLTVNPDNLTWYLVNAVKELSVENTALKSRLDAAGL